LVCGINLGSSQIKVHYYNDTKNFGDCLNKTILEKFGYKCVPTHPYSAELFFIGSLLDRFPEYGTGIILGSGLMFEKQFHHFQAASILRVRGPETAKLIGMKGCPVGDPGLLVSNLFSQAPKADRIGIVPHYTDFDSVKVKHLQSSLGKQAIIINVCEDVSTVIKKISSCTWILSSSLHGLIVADSYGIPATWVKFGNKVLGDGFKFYDYHSSIELERDCLDLTTNKSLPHIQDAKSANNQTIEDLQAEITHDLTNLKKHLIKLRVDRLRYAIKKRMFFFPNDKS